MKYTPLLLLPILILLSGCGQVITRPTATPPAAPTMTATAPPIATATTPPTATPAPYTPEPTATPTLEPTPIIHKIESGETLIAIAGRYGVSVQAIQETNGVTDPRALRIGQELIIPVDEADRLSAGTPTPLPTALPVEISALYFGRSANGDLWALGEAGNPGDLPLEAVRISLTLLDAANDPLISGETLLPTDLLDPVHPSPFAITFADPPADFANYIIETLSAYPAHLGGYYRDLEAVILSAEGERYRTYTISGLIRNTGPEDAVEVSLTATLYDALDQVIGFRSAAPEHNVIPRGGETAFTIEIIPLGGPVARSEVIAEGRRRPTPAP